QEVKAQHRQHIGTGTTGQVDGSGFNSHSYRNTQRSLLESGDVSSAVQINQLGYAHHPGFAAASRTNEGRAANDSYNTMVDHMGSVTYANGAHQVSVPVNGRQRAEMHLARRAAQTGRYPTIDEENEARRRFGVQEYN
ncbi:MAG: hypothetical protein NE330_09985, partial [Lentisphaeraceae bacterium]|nr:hypothetical protein [Lentisphaeraceae bacterium]